MRVTAIAVVGTNSVIGDGHSQPFAFREDWARFQAVTMGHPIIMGRHTLEAMGRYLPGRTTIVVSRHPEHVDLSDRDDAPSYVVTSVESALEVAESLDTVCFVGGGGQVYRQAWDQLTELDITEAHAAARGTVTFPNVDADQWRLLDREPHREFDFTRRFRITRTQRLELDPVTTGDAEEWIALHTDPRLYRHAPEAMVTDRDRLLADVELHRRSWLDDGLGYWVVRDRVTGRFLGAGGARHRQDADRAFWNLYYRFTPEAQGLGYATELASATVRELSVIDSEAELRAYVRPTNTASIAVAERIGLQQASERLDEHGVPQRIFAAGVASLPGADA